MDELYVVGDFNGDQYLDLIIASRTCGFSSCFNEQTNWYEFNESTSHIEFKELLIDDIVTSMAAVDLTSDQVDEFVFTHNSGHFIWDLSQQPIQQHTTNRGIRTNEATIFDIDGNGLMDFIYPYNAANNINYYEYGSGFAVTEKAFAVVSQHGYPIHYGDFNQDGALDMVARSANPDSIVIQYNTSLNRGPAAVPVPMLGYFSLLLMFLAICVIGFCFGQKARKP